MMRDDEYIKGLVDELNSDIKIRDVNIFQAFSPYVRNRNSLRQVVTNGILRYEYIHFITAFKGTSFETDIKKLVDLFHKSYMEFPNQSLDILADSYWRINQGLNNATQIALLQEPDLELSRTDLFANYAFMQIGNIIEGTYKPYLRFFYEIFMLSNNKSPHESTLGTYTQVLIAWDSVFEHILKTVFYGIEISQWRNIADHHSYRLLDEDRIEVSFRMKVIKIKVITRNQLEGIFPCLDNMIYLLKTVYTLISIDHLWQLHDKVATQGEITVGQDVIITQIVAISSTYGYITTICRKEEDIWKIVVKEKVPQPIYVSRTKEYITDVLRYTEPNTILEIYDYFGIKIFCAVLKDRKLFMTKL